MKTINNYIYVKKINTEQELVCTSNSDIIPCEILEGNKKGTKILVHSYVLEPYSDGFFCLGEDVVAELKKKQSPLDVFLNRIESLLRRLS